jgi:hypothetical protein
VNDHPPVLFLDVDGVLNRCGASNQGLETDKCDRLANLCRLTGCRVVVSSTWRKKEHQMDRLLGLFRSRGIVCIGQTPELVAERKLLDGFMLYTAKPRRDEIRAWLDAHPRVARYAILDDDPGADDNTGRFVRTNSDDGLQDSHVAKLQQLLR